MVHTSNYEFLVKNIYYITISPPPLVLRLWLACTKHMGAICKGYRQAVGGDTLSGLALYSSDPSGVMGLGAKSEVDCWVNLQIKIIPHIVDWCSLYTPKCKRASEGYVGETGLYSICVNRGNDSISLLSSLIRVSTAQQAAYCPYLSQIYEFIIYWYISHICLPTEYPSFTWKKC